MKPDPYKGIIKVYNSNIINGPIFESTEANTVVMCDENGEPVVILARMVDNTWVMGTNKDDDWDAVKKRFGVER